MLITSMLTQKMTVVKFARLLDCSIARLLDCSIARLLDCSIARDILNSLTENRKYSVNNKAQFFAQREFA